MYKDIAIIGIGGIFPESDNIREFYHNLTEGRDSIRPLSQDRKQNTSLDLDKDYKKIGFLKDIDKFDCDFFNISKKEAKNMAPQHRLILSTVYKTIENAAYNIDELKASNTATFISSTGLDYINLAEEPDPTLKVNNLNSSIAGRVARFFDFRGSALMIDTACSSSLVAVHYACKELIMGDSDYAIACGVKLHVFPPLNSARDDIGIASSDGRTRSFSSDADGTGSGEAVGCVLLKPLVKAQEHSDNIHAVIKGSAVNQDAGLSSTFTAPDSRAQAAVMCKAWDNACINPEDIGYIEAHGTGTNLGDPIEVKGLDLSFSKFTSKKRFCAISSVKSNFGHTDSAAGICGLIKAVLAIKHNQLFASVHFKLPNPLIDFDNSAVYVTENTRPWTIAEGKKRIAGVSSFGISGTNCHIVLEEAPTLPPTVNESVENEWLFTFSAKNRGSLKSNIASVLTFLKSNQSISLNDLSYTLNHGRKHYSHRFAITANKIEDIIDKLEQYVFEKEVYTRNILVFSRGSKVNKSLIKSYIAHSSTFESAYSFCLSKWIKGWSRELLATFAYQYALYKFLNEEGVVFQYLIGDNFGKEIIAVIKGDIPLTIGLERAVSSVLLEEDLQVRVTKFIEKEGASQKLLFVSFIDDSQVIQFIKSTTATNSVYVVDEEKKLLKILRNLYVKGANIDFVKFTEKRGGRKLELPEYNFKKERCWLRPVSEFRKINIKDWIQQIHWKEESIKPYLPSQEQVLLIGNRNDFSNQLYAKLSEIHRCILVTIDESEKIINQLYQLNSSEPKPQRIIYISDNNESLSNIFRLHEIYKFFKMEGINGLTIISPIEKHDAFSGLDHALLRGIQTENPHKRFKHISLFNEHLECLDQLALEIFSDDRMSYVSFKNGKRQIPFLIQPDFSGINLDRSNFQKNDTFLVTGGTSGITFEVCKSIISEIKNCSFIIIGRTNINWDNNNNCPGNSPTNSEKLNALIQLKELGARLWYYGANIADSEEIKIIGKKINKLHDQINGVIHGAGIGCGMEPFEHKSSASMSLVLQPKIQGTLNLYSMIESFHPRFVVLFSSVGAIVPNVFSTDYAIANAFLDAYATSMSLQGKPFISINWPGWKESGMSSTHKVEGTDELRLTNEDGVKAFRYAIAIGEPNVIISNVDIEGFKINPFFKFNTKEVLESAQNEIAELELTEEDSRSKLFKIWKEVLEVENITEHSNFFDIGGHSLNGNQLLSGIEKQFGIQMDFDELFDYCTIDKLAEHLDTSVT